jgi:hypothetical protein
MLSETLRRIVIVSDKMQTQMPQTEDASIRSATSPKVSVLGI